MNQILEYGTEKNNKEKKTGGQIADRIIRFLAIFLMIFAVFLIGSGLFSIVKNKKDSDKSNIPVVSTTDAEISAEIDESKKQVEINITSEVEISKVTYNWNTETDLTIDGENKTEFTKLIDLPSGTNKLKIRVTDVEGHETDKDFTFESVEGADIITPNITLTVTEDKKLLITATDETAMAYITYRWQDDEEVTIKAEEDGQKEISEEIDIPIGKNTVTVIAVDASDKHNTKTETKSLLGVTKPEIYYSLIDNDSTLSFTVKHENGIKKIYYILNGKPFEQTFEESNISNEIEFIVPLDPGYNLIDLKVTSVDNVVADFYGECTNPNGQGGNSGNVENTDRVD